MLRAGQEFGRGKKKGKGKGRKGKEKEKMGSKVKQMQNRAELRQKVYNRSKKLMS